MNLKLKNKIKEILANGQDLAILISEDSLDRILNHNGLMRGHAVYYETISNAVITDGNIVIKDTYSLREIINTLNIDYCYLEQEDNQFILTWEYNKHVKEINPVLREEFLEEWINGTTDRVVISHLNCSDGTGTAAVIKHFEEHMVVDRGDIEYIFLNYKDYDLNELAKKLSGKTVYIGDFSFLPEELETIEKSVNSMVIVDHHESPFLNKVGNKNYVHIDMARSGALLSWYFFFKDTDIHMPYIITLISDRDLWNFFHGNYSRALAIMTDTNGQEIIYDYITNPTNIGDSKLLEDLKPFISKVEELDIKNKKLAKRAERFIINGIEMYGMNYTSKPSDLLNTISTIYGTPGISYFINEKGITFSLRNATDEISMQEIASLFGGGGHLQAAGFTINHKEFDYNKFFTTKEINIKV